MAWQAGRGVAGLGVAGRVRAWLARFIKDTLAWVAYPRQGGPSVREWRLNSAAIRQEEAAIAENAYYAEQLLNHVPRDMWPALGITPYEEEE